MRHHVEVHASHREKEWSASLIEKDPEVVPDVDIAAQVGRDFFLDEKIPRHESGQGYVKVLEHSVMWKETAASKIFTYQGLTTCTEVENGWTVMSSVYNHLRQGKERSTRATRTPRSEGISIPHVEAATSPTIVVLSSTTARRVSGHGAPFLPQCR
jgi:hypothetical protein